MLGEIEHGEQPARAAGSAQVPPASYYDCGMKRILEGGGACVPRVGGDVR